MKREIPILTPKVQIAHREKINVKTATREQRDTLIDKVCCCFLFSLLQTLKRNCFLNYCISIESPNLLLQEDGGGETTKIGPPPGKRKGTEH